MNTVPGISRRSWWRRGVLRHWSESGQRLSERISTISCYGPSPEPSLQPEVDSIRAVLASLQRANH